MSNPPEKISTPRPPPEISHSKKISHPPKNFSSPPSKVSRHPSSKISLPPPPKISQPPPKKNLSTPPPENFSITLEKILNPQKYVFSFYLFTSFPSLFKKKSENFGGVGGLNPSLNTPLCSHL